MTRGKRRLVIWLGAVLGVFVIGAAALAILVSPLGRDKAKQYISTAVTSATGRQLTINGDLELDLGWIARVSASGIRFQNAEWSQNPQMLEVEAFDVEVDLWQLLTRFRLVIPGATISRPKVILEKNAQGSGNWEFRAASAVTPEVPEHRGEFPVIENLFVNDAVFLYDDPVSKTHLDLRLTAAQAAGFLDGPVKLQAEGTYQKLPLTVALEGGSYENLRSSTEPYPLRIDLDLGKLKVKLDGNLTEPLAMKGEDVALDIRGDDMANLFPILRLVFPSTPPYRLNGRLKREGKVWSFENFSGGVGGSDLSGDIRVDTAPERPFMKADLASNLLDFEDLAGFIGGEPGKAPRNGAARQKQAKTAENDDHRIFPDQSYDLERLKAMDASVRLRAKKILAPKLPIDHLDAKLNLKGGVLTFAPAAFGVANGRMEIFSTFDGSRRPSTVKIDARMHRLDLKRFVPESSFAQKTIGPIGGRIVLTGSGGSFRELMATASGNSFAFMTGGQISELLVQLAGLEVARTLGVLARGDKPIPIRCALLSLKGEDGQMDVETLAFDTANSVITGDGTIDLRNEKVDMVLTPVPKRFSPLSLRSFIRVSGPFSDISAFPDPLQTGTESFLAKVINVLTVLLLSPLQPRDLGLGKDVACDALIASVQKQDPKGIVFKDFPKAAEPPAADDRDRDERSRSGGRERATAPEKPFD